MSKRWKTDKLHRWRTLMVADLTARMDVPFWCTLTPFEMERFSGRDKQAFFLENADDRRELRNFVRALCG